jgi:hypothetical protein
MNLSNSSRRTILRAAAAAVFVPHCLRANEHFEKTVWFEKIPGSDKPKDLEGSLQLDRSRKTIRFFSQNTKRLEIDLDTVSNLVYERAKRPRYAAGLLFAWPLLFTKTKKHYFTVQFKDDAGEGQYALFQLHKKNYREVLAAFEAASGIRVERLEES